MVVNDLPLPRALLSLLEARRWQCPADRSLVDSLFPDHDGLFLFQAGLMESETRAWFREEMRSPMLLGEPDPDYPPGDVDPRLTVFVADLGHGFDQPIALDYRVSAENPRVLTLHWSARNGRNRWVEIAPDIEAFAELVGL